MSIENTRKSIVSIAKIYLGYREGNNNYNQFGDWYGLQNQPWCAIFVSFCAAKAGVSQDVIKKFASCSVGWNWFATRGNTRNPSYVPQQGDIIFFDWEPEKGDGMDHVGIVDRVSDGTVYTVEGNHSDQVNQYSYPLNSNEIYGYVVPDYTGNEVMDETIGGGSVTSPSSSYPTIARGSAGEYVREAQNILIDKGYLLGIYGVDGIFGTETEQVVKSFQADNNLTADGIIGPNTWAKLNNSSTSISSSYPGSVIGMGDRGENVVKIQNELIRRGYDVPGGADGQFGSGCKSAVIQFQQDRGLSADGIVGKQTWDALFPQSGIISSYPGFIIDMGAIGVEVEAIQRRLISLNYSVPGGVDGQFGSGCRNAIRQFQADHGLEVDGSVGKATWDALFPHIQVGNPYPGYLIAFGMSDNNVLLIQRKLSDLKYPVGKIDGIFGSSTKSAVINFQILNGLAGDGIVGEMTWNKLFDGPIENPTTTTNTLKEKNQPVFRMIEKLYSYAAEYYIIKHHHSANNLDKNLLVLQYLRYGNYPKNSDLDEIAWSTVTEALDTDFVEFINSKNDENINRNLRIYLKGDKSISLPHLAVTLETNVVKNFNDSQVNGAFSDLAGWAGDLITFARDLTNERGNAVMGYGVPMIQDLMFSDNYSFPLEDLYQDIDAVNLSTYLHVFDIGSIFRIYYDLDRTRMAERRFSLFLTSRITNGLLLNEISSATTSKEKLRLLARKYLVREFNSINSSLALAFSVFFKASFDNSIFAPNVAEAFANNIVSFAYKEA